MNKKTLIEVNIDVEALDKQIKALRMVTLLNQDPLLKDLVDTLKVMSAIADTEYAKLKRDGRENAYKREKQQADFQRMMENAKNHLLPAPWDYPPFDEKEQSLRSPKVYSSGIPRESVPDSIFKKLIEK